MYQEPRDNIFANCLKRSTINTSASSDIKHGNRNTIQELAFTLFKSCLHQIEAGASISRKEMQLEPTSISSSSTRSAFGSTTDKRSTSGQSFLIFEVARGHNGRLSAKTLGPLLTTLPARGCSRHEQVLLGMSFFIHVPDCISSHSLKLHETKKKFSFK